MSDIFISYANKDQARIKPLAKALKSLGWSVWWDRTIPVGKNYREVITEALKVAKCVIVVWTKNSALSNWVLDEANVGLKKEILLPVLIEDGEIPLGFGGIQSANLIDWQESLLHSGFEQLTKAISNILRNPPKKSKKIKKVSLSPHQSLDSSKNFIQNAHTA